MSLWLMEVLMKALRGMNMGTLPILMIVLFAGLLLGGCAPRIVLDPGIPSSVVQIGNAMNEVAAAVPSGNADRHYIQPDDYFFREDVWPGSTWEIVELGKLITPPTPETKNQAQFMSVKTGAPVWAKWWVKTRIATRADLQLGKEVICFDSNSYDDVYLAPENTEMARTDTWFIARITDTSELFRGYVLVSGGYKVSEKNLRVILQ